MSSCAVPVTTLAIVLSVGGLLLAPIGASGQAEASGQGGDWRVVSHEREWRQFLEAAPRTGRWAAFEASYYTPNRALLDGFLRKIGIDDPAGFLRDRVRALDLEAARAAEAGRRAADVDALVRAAVSRSIGHLPAQRYAGEIHLLDLFGMLDGMALLIDGTATVVLDRSELAATDPADARLLVAHELNHAVRWAALGDPVPEGGTFLDTRVGDSMVAEGLAVAFSRIVYPGLPRDRYIPYFRIHPGKLQPVAEAAGTIRAALLRNRDAAIGSSPVNQYFYGTGPNDLDPPFRNAAYYIGDRLVTRLLDTGASIASLTVTPTDQILDRAGDGRRVTPAGRPPSWPPPGRAAPGAGSSSCCSSAARR